MKRKIQKSKKGGAKRAANGNVKNSMKVNKLDSAENIKKASSLELYKYITENDVHPYGPLMEFLYGGKTPDDPKYEEHQAVREKLYCSIDNSIDRKKITLHNIEKILLVLTRMNEEAEPSQQQYMDKLFAVKESKINEIVKNGSNIRNYLCHKVNRYKVDFNDPIILEFLKEKKPVESLKEHINKNISTFSEKTIDTLKDVIPQLITFMEDKITYQKDKNIDSDQEEKNLKELNDIIGYLKP